MYLRLPVQSLPPWPSAVRMNFKLARLGSVVDTVPNVSGKAGNSALQNRLGGLKQCFSDSYAQTLVVNVGAALRRHRTMRCYTAQGRLTSLLLILGCAVDRQFCEVATRAESGPACARGCLPAMQRPKLCTK